MLLWKVFYFPFEMWRKWRSEAWVLTFSKCLCRLVALASSDRTFPARLHFWHSNFKLTSPQDSAKHQKNYITFLKKLHNNTNNNICPTHAALGQGYVTDRTASRQACPLDFTATTDYYCVGTRATIVCDDRNNPILSPRIDCLAGHSTLNFRFSCKYRGFL